MNFENRFNQQFNLGISEKLVDDNLKKEEVLEKSESSRKYDTSPILSEIRENMIVYEKPITPDTKVCLIGDGQGADTLQFLALGVKPENIKSINYEQPEVETANKNNLKDTGVEMEQGDATQIGDFYKVGIEDESQDLVTLLHVLEVPDIKNRTEKELVANLVKILKADGELLVSQYKHKLTAEQAQTLGVEAIKSEDLEKRFGENWQVVFEEKYGQKWFAGMHYSEISNIRTKEELIKLFEEDFDIKLQESAAEYILKAKKKQKI